MNGVSLRKLKKTSLELSFVSFPEKASLFLTNNKLMGVAAAIT